MKLSVIIPCYNAERYLGECLDSLLAQDVSDFEVILIDDGSRDGTAQIAQCYALRDERIRIIRQVNAGVSAARNAGLRVAQGEWVLFVDADDVLPQYSFSKLLSCACDGVDLVVSMHETFDDTGISHVVYPETRWMDKTGEAARHAAALRLIEGDTVLNIMCNKLHRREKLAREGMWLTCGVKIAEDALFNLEAVLCAEGVAFCDQVTYRYRSHAASATQTRAKSEFDVHLPWLKAMAAMLKKRGVFERYYPAYIASVALRLYKDAGMSGVMKEFNKKALELVLVPVDRGNLSARGRVLRILCESRMYPAAYPLIFPFELIARKIREAAFALRVRRGHRGSC